MSAPTTMQWLRQAGHRLSAGSGRLSALLAAGALRRAQAVWRRGASWLGESTGLAWLLRLGLLLLAAAIVRKAVTAVGVALYERAASGAAPGLLWGAAAVWVVAAYRVGRDGWTPKQAHAVEEAVPEGGKEQPGPDPAASSPPPAAPLPVSPVALVAAVRDIGTPHAQLKPLAEHLGTTTDAVRAAAARDGWPVKDVRMQGRSASAGLRWDEVPSPHPAGPFPGVVGAGQAADDDNDDTGRGFTTVPDEVNPVRTHVVWADRAAS